jgi:competence transcription factor ComK
MIRDNIQFYNTKIDQICISCNSFEHSVLVCPLLHLKVDKEKVILKDNFSQYQPRIKDYHRNKERINYNSLYDRDLTRNDLMKFRFNLLEFFEPMQDEELY